MKKIFLATNNHGKIERFKNLLNQIDNTFEIYTPQDLNIEPLDIEENGKTLSENAIIKAKAYLGKVDMSILANDTGFYVEGEGLVETPKRIALGETNERTLTKEEIGEKLLNFWKGVATKYGGKVDAAWVESFALIDLNGSIKIVDSRREVVLTDQEFGKAHIQMPVRTLYYSKTTNKPAILHTQEEEVLEMSPVIEALRTILN
ncbi:MAG: XTP/dITP diphosphatase [Candidatus Taylorbacteria bacterium]|nr:XTP/dITP diphosphatase [Candidatus Taylorbacteria bacterium]